MSDFADRTTSDLLTERRANVQEMRRETDQDAIDMLQYHIESIDHEIGLRRAARKGAW